MRAVRTVLFYGHAAPTLLDGSTMADSLSKAKLSSLRKLHHKKVRDSENQFLIEGWHLLEAAIEADLPLRTLVYDESRKVLESDQKVMTMATQRAEAVYSAGESQMKALGETKTSSGVVALVDRPSEDWDSVETLLAEREEGFVVVLDGVSDPGNCGSIIRACDWFGADAVILGEGCSDRENGKLVRATMGSLFHLPVVSVDRIADSLRGLQKSGYRVVASSLSEAETLQGYQWPRKTALVVGNEARGVSDAVYEITDTRLRIPKTGKAESLNAAMAASVMLGHWRMGV